MKILHGENGLFAATDSRKGNDGKYRSDIYFPNRSDLDTLSKAVIDAYFQVQAREQPYSFGVKNPEPKNPEKPSITNAMQNAAKEAAAQAPQTETKKEKGGR